MIPWRGQLNLARAAGHAGRGSTFREAIAFTACRAGGRQQAPVSYGAGRLQLKRGVSRTLRASRWIRAIAKKAQMTLELTAAFRKVQRGYIALSDLPGCQHAG